MKALCVFSGGLDSMLAARLIEAQGIDVLAVFFETPFFGAKKAVASAQSTGLSYRVVNITRRHLEVVKQPTYGYGGNMNPCIDCHALMFRIAGEMLEPEGASFVISGEVLGQRPMSQNKKSLHLIAEESGLNGLLLRPLSAKLLPITVPEREGWVDRQQLMAFQGRSRKPQMALARELQIAEYPSPAGGCLLTEKAFSRRLRDLLSHRPEPELREIELLKLGRHFRIGAQAKLVVGRNKRENDDIRDLAGDDDLLLTSVSAPGPTALLMGDLSDESIQLAGEITASYGDGEPGSIAKVKTMSLGGEGIIRVDTKDKEGFRPDMI
jgi:tRNA U34 2-thiouridine synthase MnmA/TrmU